MKTNDEDIQILGVDFGEGYDVMEIHYIERRDIAPQGFNRQSLTIDVAALDDEDDVKEIIDSLASLVDEAMRYIHKENDV